jgi:hypothetical protein
MRLWMRLGMKLRRESATADPASGHLASGDDDRRWMISGSGANGNNGLQTCL